MADEVKKVKVSIEGKDNSSKAFKSASNNANLFKGTILDVNDAFMTLAKSTIAYFSTTKVLEQISLGVEGFQKELDIINLTNERIKSAGISLEEATPKIDGFVESLESMGMSGEEARDAVGRLALKTKDLEEAMRLSKIASDLSASGYGTITENVDRLSKVLTGNGSRALLEYGIKMEGTHSAIEQLNAIESKITRTTEEFADTTQGRLQIAEERWDNFRKGLGKIVVFVRDEAIVAFNDLGTAVENSTSGLDKEDTGKKWAKWIDQLRFGLTNLGDLVAERLASLTGLDTEASKKQMQDFYDKLLENEQQFEKMYSDLAGETEQTNDDLSSSFDDLSDDAEKTAEKVKQSFTEIARKLVSAYNEETSAISKLRNELKELESDTADQLENADEKYQQDVVNRAKQAQEKIDQIDKEIADEKQTRGQGWRSRIAELEKEKAQEQDILARAGGEVSDLKEKIAKDDLDKLKEDWQAERKTIQEESDKTKAEKESELNTAITAQLRTVVASLSPDILDTLMAENQSFLGEIGAGSNQYIFNFNGDVNDKDKLISIITEALNRQATLKGVAGK